MADNILELYQRYLKDVYPQLMDDGFFRYLFECVQTGDNAISQKNKLLHKVVDETWVNMVEEALPSIFALIDGTTRFVDKDSYENRFIYTLISRLIDFIGKRSEVLLWKTRDEAQSLLAFESIVDDDYEKLEYRFEMRITNTQSDASNDSENMNIFMRIDRLKRIVSTVGNSAFYELMKGCKKLDGPITDTEVIAGSEDYQKCKALWNFFDSYDQIGYKIIQEESALSFDNAHIAQLYANMIANYVLLRTLSGPDARDITNLLDTKRETVEPKFVKRIEEQQVDSPDIEDVEIRRVFVEEVTKAQLEAEANYAKIKEANRKLQDETDSMRLRMETALEEAAKATELANAAREISQRAGVEIADANAARDEALAAKKEAEEIRDQAIKDKALAEEAASDAVAEKERAAIEAAEAINSANETKLNAQAQIEEAIRNAQSTVDEATTKAWNEANEAIKKAEERANRAIDLAEDKANQAISDAENKANQAITDAESKANQAIESSKDWANRSIEEANIRAEASIQNIKDECRAVVEEATKLMQEAESARMIAEQERDASNLAYNEIQERIKAIEAKAEIDVESAKQFAEETARRALEEADVAVRKSKAWAEQLVAETNQAAEEAVAKANDKQRVSENARVNYEKEVAISMAEARSAKDKAERMMAEAKEMINQATVQIAEARTLKEQALEEKKAAERAVSIANKNAQEAVAVARKADARYQKEKETRERLEKKVKKQSGSSFLGIGKKDIEEE